MLEKLISDLLNQHLGQFIDDVDMNQLGASIYSGQLHLTNLSLKRNLFDNSPFPFGLKYGRVGRIYLKIPFWDMFKSPLVVEIEDVFGYVEMKKMENWSEEAIRKAYQETTQSVLQDFELMIKHSMLIKEAQRDTSCSFAEKLTARIIDNLQVSIKNIYFRFEDHILEGKQAINKKYCIGIKLQSFSIFTGDSEYKRIKTPDTSNKSENQLTYKVAKLKGLSLFCDWQGYRMQFDKMDFEELVKNQLQADKDKKTKKDTTPKNYIEDLLKHEFSDENQKDHKNIIDNFMFELRLQINKNSRNPLVPATLDHPQISAQIIIGNKQGLQNLCLFQPQILRVLKLMELIGFYNDFKEGVLTEFLKKDLTSEEVNLYINDYIGWRAISDDPKKMAKPEGFNQAKFIRDRMKKIEESVDNTHIIKARKSGIEKIKHQDGRQKKLDEIEAEIQKILKQKIGMGLLMSSSKKVQIEREVRKSYAKQIDEIRAQYDQGTDYSITDNVKGLISEFQQQDTVDLLFDPNQLPADYVVLDMRLQIPSLQISLENEYDQSVATLGLKELDFAMKYAKKFTILKMEMDELMIKDNWSNNKYWPELIGVNNKIAQEKSDSKIMSVIFEQNTDFKECPFHLTVQLGRPLFVVANIPLLQEIERTMSVALQNEKLDFEYFTQLALGRINQLRDTAKQMADKLKQGQYQHVNASIDAYLFAPIFIIPEDIFSEKQKYLQLDMGKISINSKLIEYDQKTKYSAINEKSLIYDQYLGHFEKLSLRYIKDTCTHQLVKEISFNMTIFKNLEPLHPIHPTILLDVSFKESILLHMDMEIIDMMLNHLYSVMNQLQNREFNIIQRRMENTKEIAMDNGVQQKFKELKAKTFQNDDMTEEDLDEFQDFEGQVEKIREFVAIKNTEDQKTLHMVEKEFTDMQMKFKLNHLQIKFGNLDHQHPDSKQAIFIDLNLKQLYTKMSFENNQQDIAINFSVQTLEIKEQSQTNQIFYWNSLKEPQEKQLSIKMHLSEGSTIDKVFGSCLESTISLTLNLQQTICHLNLECTSRIISQVGHLQDISDALIGMADLKAIEATQRVIEALKGKKGSRSEYLRKVFENLGSHEQEVIEINEKYINILGEKIGTSQEDQQPQEVVKAIQEQELRVIQSTYMSKIFKIKLKIQAIEFWLSDFNEKNNLENIAQIMKFKFRSQIEYNSENIIQNVLCQKKHKFENIVRGISKNEQISVNLDGISISQEIFKTWKMAQEMLSGSESKGSMTSLLEPTKIEVKLKTDSFLLIEKVTKIEVKIESLSMNMDYNNIGHIYFLLKRYQETIQPNLTQFQAQIQSKLKQIKNKVKDKIAKVIKENVLTASSMQCHHSNQSEMANVKELIDYAKGEIIDPNEPEIYKREIDTQALCFKVIKLQFIDAQLSNYIENENFQPIPLIQLVLKDLELTHSLRKLPAIENEEHKESLDNHCFMQIHSQLELDATYFNQITQVFEPFIEPWLFQLSISQQKENGEFSIIIRGEEQLICNLTYGMALSLRNIYVEALEQIYAVDDLFEVKDNRQQVVQKVETKEMSHLQKHLQKDHSNTVKQAFVFINSTGMEVKFWKSGQQFDENAKLLDQKTISLSDNLMAHKSVDYKFFGEQKVKGDFQIETSLLTIDLKFKHFQEIHGIPIENNGVYSFKCTKIQKDKKAKKKEINLIATVKSFGTQRMIQFESPLSFANNNEFPLSLRFEISSKEEICSTDHVIQPNEYFNIPLQWYTFESKTVNVFIIKKSEESNSLDDLTKGTQLIMEDITSLFNKSPDSPPDKNEIKSQIVELNSDFYTSVDIYGYKCLPLHTEESNPIQYFVCMNPPLVIKNLCLCPMEVFEIDDPETPDQKVKRIAQIAPADSQNIIQLDISEENKSYIGMQFRDNDKDMWFSQVMKSLRAIEGEKAFLRHDTENEIVQKPDLDQTIYNPVNLSFEQIKKPISYIQNIDLREKIVEKSLGIQLNIYNPLIIVNKTRVCLFAQDIQINSFSSEFLNSKDKVIVSAGGFKPSIPIDLKTIGLTGTIVMDSEDPKSGDQLQFGVSITQGDIPYNKTVILTIVPRYMLINNLQTRIDVRQSVKNMKHYDPQLQVAMVRAKEENDHVCELHLKNFGKGKVSEKIMVRLMDDNMERDVQADEYCPPFSIDQLDDFQTEMQPVKMDKEPIDWFMPCLENNFKRLVRVIITPNTQDCDATTLIIFDDPAIEEFQIVNQTNNLIYFRQYHQKPFGEMIELCPLQKQNFVWGYREVNQKSLIIKDESKKLSKVISLDKISKMNKKTKVLEKVILFKQDGNQYYQTLTMTELGTKVITIGCHKIETKRMSFFGNKPATPASTEDELLDAFDEESELDDTSAFLKGFTLDLFLKGFNFSIIDNQPRELVNVTIQNMCLIASQKESKFDEYHEIKTNVKATLGLLQIDNLINEQLPVILGPSKLYERQLLEIQNNSKHSELYKMMNYIQIKNAEEIQLAQEMPFLIVEINKTEKNYEGKLGSIIKYDQIHFAIQEFFLQAETQIIIKEKKFIQNILNLLDYSNIELIKKRKKGAIVIQNYDKKVHKKSYEICPQIDARKGINLDANRISVNKISFGIIMLGSIRCQLTLQLEKTRLVDLDIQAGRVVNFMSPIINSFASIENSKLWFNELVIMEGFVTEDMLTNCIYNHYWHQFQRQILRLLGSSNLLGNPASLMDKVGLGIYEMARDPLQGMKQGPSGFVYGVGSGMQGVVKGVVGGGFESLSKTTGSLYTVVKQSTGNEDNRGGEKVEGLGQGIKQGIKGAGSEVAKGLHGIFANPLKGAKEGGFSGFRQGVKKGVVGAISAPVAGVLRAGESISQGVSAGANNFSNYGKSQLELFDPKLFRVRASRRIDIKGQIKALDYNLLIISYYLSYVDMNTFRFQQIRWYEIMPQLDQTGETIPNKSNILVVTSDHILLIQALNFLDIRKQYIAKNQVIFCEKLSNFVKYEITLAPSKYSDDGTKTPCKYYMSLIFGSENQFQDMQSFDQMKEHVKTKTTKYVQILTKDVEDIRPNAINGVVQGKTSTLIPEYCDSDTILTFGNPRNANLEILRIQNLVCSKKHQFVVYTQNFESLNQLHLLFHHIPIVQENLSSQILFEAILEKDQS